MFNVGDAVWLTDASGRNIGSVRVTDVSPLWVSGDFTSRPQFGEVEALFAECEQLVNDSLIGLLDPVMDAITELGICLPKGNVLRDLQIYPAARAANWRPSDYPS